MQKLIKISRIMEIQKFKQTVYLPVKVEDEIPELDGYYRTQEEGTSYLHNGNWFNNHLLEKPRYPIHWLKEQESFVFTPEQLNEYTANVIKQTLETAAEKAEIKEDTLDTESYKKADEFAERKSYSYVTDTDGCLVGVDTFEVNKQSITNTFEETYQKFKV